MKVGNSVRYAGAAAAVAGLAALGLVAIAGPSALAQTPPPLKIGVMDGFSGVYGDLTAGEVEAMQMAIEDVGGKVLGRSVEILSADHQTKPDVGASIARKWYDVDGVKMITGLGTSSVALAVRKVSQEKGQIDINTGAASADLTGPACSETGAHWVYDTYALAHVTGDAMVKAGGDTWFFLTADYAFGHALERDVTEVVKAAGGKVLGSVKHPLSTQDFSSFLLQAQSSKAKVIGLANAGQDTINSIKQAGEFGIVKGGQKLAGLLVFATDVQSLTLPVAQGLLLGSQRRDPRLDQALPRQEGPPAQHADSGRLQLDSALPQGRAGGGHRRTQGRDGQDARAAGQRRHDQERQAARGRPPGARHVPVRGEVAGRVQEQGRHLQADLDRAGRQGLPAAERRQVPVREGLSSNNIDVERAPSGALFYCQADNPW
jgi:ABC-type branched-subunit amino acid transport system substrate-binding protein